MLIAGYSFCGNCGMLKSPGPFRDCHNCYEREKNRMLDEINEELQ